MTVSNLWSDTWAADGTKPEWKERIAREVAEQHADPYGHSHIKYWLRLDLWGKNEGLLVLTGIDPKSVPAPVDENPFVGSVGWDEAQPFRNHFSFSYLPYVPWCAEAEFGRNVSEYQRYLNDQDIKYDLLRKYRQCFHSLHHKLEHSTNPLGPEAANGGWRPTAFIAWAKSLDFTPEWLEWAVENGLLQDQLDPTPGPFFDPDAPEYPELLHIAVRAWDAARSGKKGTPKQRVDKFLQERYPQMATSTRAAIALITNWQKIGGRPSKVDE